MSSYSLLLLLLLISWMPPWALAFMCGGKQSQFDTKMWSKHQRRKDGVETLSLEKDLIKRGFYPIIGSDESGRGCIAGPVVAASCCILLSDWSEYQPIEGVHDSKKLTPELRQRIFDEVTNNPDLYAWHVSERSSQEIDDSNILIATMDCFKESIEGLAEKLPDDHKAYSIVDGQKTPKVSIPCRPYVKGDANVYTIALASILAKVSRDRLAAEWHEKYPEYGFDEHKGYITPGHIEAIHKHGPCPIHRLSFKSLKGR
jgi:ribonuclease HII